MDTEDTFLRAVENFSEIGELSFLIKNLVGLGEVGTVVPVGGRHIVGLRG